MGEPQTYLTDVINKIVNRHPNSKIVIHCFGPIPLHKSSQTCSENDAYDHIGLGAVDFAVLLTGAAAPTVKPPDTSTL